MNALATAILETLSPSQRVALGKAAIGPLSATPAGWLPKGRAFDGASTRTVESLAQQGYLEFVASRERGRYASRGTYQLTELGAKAVATAKLEPTL